MPEKLILRDHLALDRTNLANERTFLAYLRTALAFIILGASIVKLFPTINYIIAGLISIIIGISSLVFGIARFYQVKNKINQKYYDQQSLASQKQNAQKSNPRTKNEMAHYSSKILPMQETNSKTFTRN
ncbi:MAG: DUF202 domain-containing protein [Patescibacteria group bacterium]|nr:DUF202 domain-containing protein [Patescibacteria group bacterium]